MEQAQTSMWIEPRTCKLYFFFYTIFVGAEAFLLFFLLLDMFSWSKCNVDFYLIQVKSGTIFDNFLITNDPNLAEEVGNDTWGKTKVSPKPFILSQTLFVHFEMV